MAEKKFEYKIETERLIIRPLMNEDYNIWLNGFENRFPSQNRHDVGKMDMRECTVEWFHHLVEKHQAFALSDSTYIFSIFTKVDGSHIGMIDFSTLARDDFQWGRIGYTIHNQYWKNGYGKESVNAALNLAFRQLQYHRIEAHINLDNTPSIKLIESVGMQFECIRKGFIYEHNEWVDHLVYYKNAF